MNVKRGNDIIFPLIIPTKKILRSYNFFLYKSGNSLILIDAGWNDEDCWQGLLQTLEENRFSLKDLTHILLTHHHIDHIGLVDRIVTEHPIPVYAHKDAIPRLKRERAFLEKRISFFDTFYKEAGCGKSGKNQVAYLRKAMEKNKDKDLKANVIPFDTSQPFLDFDIIETPGHAPDQVAFYHRDRKELFGGDLLINHISSNALIEPDANGNRLRSLLQHINSFKKINFLPVETIYAGHGKVITDPKALIQKRLEGIEEKAVKLLQLIDNGVSTIDELARNYYKKKYEKEFVLVISEVTGHLDYLESQNRLHRKRIEGVYHYRPVKSLT